METTRGANQEAMADVEASAFGPKPEFALQRKTRHQVG
jgi:hypothetical protein